MEPRPPGQLYEGFGAYVRSQRELAQLSLRQAAVLARISNPYLSQIEHGLALPSIAVISALADALEVSADTLLLRAAGVASDDSTERPTATEDAIRQDPRLDHAQKHALLAVLSSYVGLRQSRAEPAPTPGGTAAAVRRAPRRRQPPKASARDREVRDDA